MELVLPNNADGRIIQEAVRNGDVGLVKQLIDENPVLLWTKTVEKGHSLLHLATINGHEDTASLLLRRGADPEEADFGGWKPLASTAMGGTPLLRIAKLLLEFGANVDSVNVQLRHSALHVCADHGFTKLAELLLEHHAQVDIEDIHGQTPLERAVRNRKTALVRLLLRHGAARRPKQSHLLRHTPLHQGISPRPEDSEIGRLLESSHLLEGPPISRVNTGQFRKAQNVLAKSPAPLENRAKMLACQSFSATIVDFFIDEKEQRIQETASVYSLLYGKGADAIMGKAYTENGIETKRSFRWYHLPANNMEWVEALVRRHFSERESGMTQYSETVAVDLGIQRTQRAHHLIPTSMGSFIRPYSCKVKNSQLSAQSHDHRLNRYIGAFIPYLHFELQRDFETMTQAVSSATRSWMEQPPVDPYTRSAVPPSGQNDHPSNRNRANPHSNQFSSQTYAGDSRHTRLERGLPHKILIDGYSQPDFARNELAVAPLQHRRTLDHYLYSHLASMARRDRDQVIQKFTAGFQDAKMFMVDQLWLWVLDDDIVISCSSMRWDAWDIVTDLDLNVDPPTEGEELDRHERFVLRDDDPLDIHQATLNYLKKNGRQSINDVESLCRVILSSCLSAFDYNETPGEYHFFDFFESAIGHVMDQTSERFQHFRGLLGAAAQRKELLSAVEIRFESETWLLGEIEDIRDELGILRRVLEDQRDVAKDLEAHLAMGLPRHDTEDEANGIDQTHLRGTRVLVHHLKRIDKMEILTARCIESIRSLLTLKQQHASLSEAHSARKQAEYTSQQAAESVFYNRSVAEQLELARKQATETSRQGNMSLLFTVVAAVFLPLSFITSFFTIELDGFPYGSDDKLPMDTVVAIILSVSAGVSVPFILVAFNFDRVKAWWAILVKHTSRMKRSAAISAFILVVLLVSLAVVLSQPLGAAVKTGAAVAISLLTIIALAFIVISYYSPSWARMNKW